MDEPPPPSPDSLLARRLARLFGPEVDPHISLAPEPPRVPTAEVVAGLLQGGGAASRYEVRGEIDRGGMGAVLEVWDRELRRPLAMKVSLSGPDAGADAGRRVARFLEEAQITAQLDHPGVVPVHELGVDDQGRVFFTMRRVQGRDLREVFHQVHFGLGDWTRRRALDVLLRVCEAVAFAHSRGVIHRDLKPANVMVGAFGEVYVMDWGLARVVGRAEQAGTAVREGEALRTVLHEERERSPDSPLVTGAGDVLGTPAYMAPEQALGELGELSPRTDVYALGAMLYHLLAREAPYMPVGLETTQELALQGLRLGPPRPLRSVRAGIPSKLVAICEKAMAWDPAARYPDVAALATDLRAYLEGRFDHPRASIFELSHLTTPLVFLYVGAFITCLGPLLVLGVAWDSMEHPARLGLAGLALVSGLGCGGWLRSQGRLRAALAPLIGCAVVAPVLAFLLLHLVPMLREAIDPSGTGERVELVLADFSPLAEAENSVDDPLAALAQRRLDLKLLLTSLAWAAAVAGLHRWTRAPLYLWLLSAAGLLAFLLAATQAGWREWADEWRAFTFLPPAALMLAAGMTLDVRRRPLESLSLVWLGFALGCVAWLAYAAEGYPVRYLGQFSGIEERALSQVLGGLLALGLGVVAMRLPTPGMVRFSVVALLAAPLGVLLALSSLVDERLVFYEVILPLACLGFVSLSILLQRKSLLYTGAGYLAVASYQITRNHFLDDHLWPFLVSGIGAAIVAASLALPALQDRLRRHAGS
jgi:serine/threonine protein kinase